MDSKNNSIRGEHVIDLVSSYLDNALEAGEHERVRAHIATCEVCGAELRELQATQQMLRAMPVQVPPRVFTLTEEMVGARPRAEASPSLLSRLFGRALAPRLATGSVLAFTLLLVMLVSDLGMLSQGLPLRTVTTGSESASGEESLRYGQRNMAAPTTTTATEMLPMFAPPDASATSGEGGEAAGTTPGEDDQGNRVPTEATPVAETNMATATTGTTAGDAPAQEQAANAPTEQAAVGDQAKEVQAEGTVLAYYDRPAPPGEDPASVSVPLVPAARVTVPINLLIELGLAILGVGLAIGALLARRKST
ncbi:MAG: zf-HC2 domain-containing protein [Chloroflexota bacterium]|nr:zf-HC2 domain-containing protein [Chloroflexota bacterium]MDQ5865045.1 zf-HC2 domain-containing protein [Chloroflexota bacterium]